MVIFLQRDVFASPLFLGFFASRADGKQTERKTNKQSKFTALSIAKFTPVFRFFPVEKNFCEAKTMEKNFCEAKTREKHNNKSRPILSGFCFAKTREDWSAARRADLGKFGFSPPLHLTQSCKIDSEMFLLRQIFFRKHFWVFASQRATIVWGFLLRNNCWGVFASQQGGGPELYYTVFIRLQLCEPRGEKVRRAVKIHQKQREPPISCV